MLRETLRTATSSLESRGLRLSQAVMHTMEHRRHKLIGIAGAAAASTCATAMLMDGRHKLIGIAGAAAPNAASRLCLRNYKGVSECFGENLKYQHVAGTAWVLGRLGNGAGSFCERDNGAWRALEVLAGRFLNKDRSLRDFKDLGHANGGWVTVMGLGPWKSRVLLEFCKS